MRILVCIAAIIPITWHSLANAQSVKTVDSVVAKAVIAMGGVKQIHNLHSLVFKGFHYEGGYKQEFAGSTSSNAVLTRMRPNMRLVGCRPEIAECDRKWGRIVEGFDGQHGWELNWPKQRLISSVNKAEVAARCGATFDAWFVGYKQRGFHAAYLGKQMLLGRDSIAVSITRDDCSQTTTYYFDPLSYQLLMQRASLPVHARGDAVDMVEVIRESRLVDGVRVTSRSEQIDVRTGDVLGGVEWTSITGNTIHDPKLFAGPPVNPQGITAIVLQMLSASQHDASVTQMMTIYKDYRNASSKDENIIYDMNWLAYELLKVDKYEYAETIFREIINENPKSAQGHENLAELYLQQHESSRALEELQRAVDLGSTDADTRKKLSRLHNEMETN